METYTCGYGYGHSHTEICKCALRRAEEDRMRIAKDRSRELTLDERKANDIRLAESRLWLEDRGVIRKRSVSQNMQTVL